MSAGCDDVGRRSSLAADPLLSGFPTLPRPKVELLARWCRLQNLTVLLGGSWVVVSGVISRVTVIITPVRGLTLHG